MNHLLLDSLRRHDKPELLWHKQGGAWRKISTRSFLRRAASLAEALKRLGIQKGDRVGLFSENRPEWHIADLATLGLGAVNVPVYPGESAERLRYILSHSESRLCFVSRREQFEKVVELWKELPRLKAVIPFEAVNSEGSEAGGRVLGWGKAAREDVSDEVLVQFERTARSHTLDDVASLIYTSGTTGTPKGALLTQENFASNVLATLGVLEHAPDDLALVLLPLCHIYERKIDYGYLAEGVSIAYAESFEKVVENICELRPTIMAVVPRFFEKFYSRLMEVMQAASPSKQKLFAWALRVGREALPYRLAEKPLPPLLWVRYGLAHLLVYRKIHARLGGRFRCFLSGGAPLAPALNEFFHALGFTILEGYGLTETSPVIAANLPGAVKLGTVGRPIPGVEVKIAEDGEILTRGPHVMKAYYKREAETREVLQDGWLRTGDIGFLDEDGFLTITDRKKDLIKTAGGKFIAPQPIENRLKQSPYIQNAVVVGDKRKYVVTLLVPDFKRAERYAASHGIAFNSRLELLENPRFREVIGAEVDAVNSDLAQYERLKRFALLPEDFSFDNGQLTYTEKVRRRKIEEHYRDLIEQLYGDEPQPAA